MYPLGLNKTLKLLDDKFMSYKQNKDPAGVDDDIHKIGPDPLQRSIHWAVKA